MNGQNWYGQGLPPQGGPYPPNGAGRPRPPLPPQDNGFRPNYGGSPMGINQGAPNGQGYGPRVGQMNGSPMGMGPGGYGNNNGGGPPMPPSNFRPGPTNLPPRPAYGTPPQQGYNNSPIPGPSSLNVYPIPQAVRPLDPRLNTHTPTPPIPNPSHPPARPPYGTPTPATPPSTSFGGGGPSLPRPTLPIPAAGGLGPIAHPGQGTMMRPGPSVPTSSATSSTPPVGTVEEAPVPRIKTRPLFCVVCASNNVSTLRAPGFDPDL